MTAPGAYVHVPFCRHRCDYCAFATWTDRAHLIGPYVDAVCRHIEGDLTASGWATFGSVFFGGGTPSLLDPGDLGRIIRALPLAADAEVTIECNPEDLDAERLDRYLEAGVTRLSVGVQSMVPRALEALGRRHDPSHVLVAAPALHDRGFQSWNVDLIYGAHGESVEDWSRTLDAVLELDPPHVSAYALTVEAGTPLAGDAGRHPDDDDLAEKYELADRALAASGRPWYEISNWARPGHACRHNRCYWAQGDYAAFGCAAHGHRAGHRWWNLRTPDRYVEAVAAGMSPVAGGEHLDAEQRRREGLELALRTRDGVPVASLPPAALDELPAGLVEVEGDRLVLTVRGRLLANEVAMRLV